MKCIFKRVIAVAIALSAVMAVSAQTSWANAKTNGVIETDVDNYMDVLDYTKVDTGNAWGFLEFENNVPVFGYAHQFGSFYLGAYASGSLPGITTTPIITTDTVENKDADGTLISTETTSNETRQTSVTSRSPLTTSALLGLPGGIGVRATVAYNFDETTNSVNNSEVTKDADGNTIAENSVSYTRTTGTSEAGYTLNGGLKIGDIGLKFGANFKTTNTNPSFVLNGNTLYDGRTTTTITTTPAGGDSTTVTTTYDNTIKGGTNVIGFGATGILPIKNGTVTINAWDYITKYNSTVSIKGKQTIKTGTTTTQDDSFTYAKSVSGRSRNELDITPSVAQTMENGKLTIGYRAAVPVTYETNSPVLLTTTEESTTNNLDSTENRTTTTTTKVYTDNRQKTSSTSIGLTLAMGGTYQLMPSKLDFNFGGRLYNLPSLTITKTVTEHRQDTSTEKPSGTTTRKNIAFSDAIPNLNLTSGLAWYVTNNVTLDTSFDILAPISTDLHCTATTLDDLLVRQFNVQVVVKF